MSDVVSLPDNYETNLEYALRGFLGSHLSPITAPMLEQKVVTQIGGFLHSRFSHIRFTPGEIVAHAKIETGEISVDFSEALRKQIQAEPELLGMLRNYER